MNTSWKKETGKVLWTDEDVSIDFEGEFFSDKIGVTVI
jgi:hypothetical protein